jgi:hypothetical protein
MEGYIGSLALNTENYYGEHYARGHSIVSQHFMEPEGSIPNSQELCTCSYLEPDPENGFRLERFGLLKNPMISFI